MSTTELEREYLRTIERDLANVEELENDPLSNAIYLYFLSRNKIQTTYIDNLIDWANTWIKQVLIDRRLSRFADRDITSAIVDVYSLRELGRLKAEVKGPEIDALLSPFISHCRFFGDFTHTCLLLSCLSNIREQISSYQICLNEVIRDLKQAEVLNDAKNLVFGAILLESVAEIEHLRSLCNYALGAVDADSIHFGDRIYFAWLLWTNRQYVDAIHTAKIRSFVQTTIEDLRWSLSSADAEVIDTYGSDTTERLSRIQLGISLDLISSFNHEPNLLAKIPSSAFLGEFRVEKTKRDALAARRMLSSNHKGMSHFLSAEDKLKNAETNLDRSPSDVIDQLGESMEALCRAYLVEHNVALGSLSGFDLHDKMIKHWKQKTGLEWTELKFQTGVKHILRIWALKKHETYTTNVLELSYLILLAWRGYQEIIRLSNQSSH